MTGGAPWATAIHQLEKLVNGALTYDPGSRAALSRLAGKVLAVEVSTPPLTLALTPAADGSVRLQSPPATTPDVSLGGGPLALARVLARAGDLHSFANTGVQIRGDQTLLMEVATILKGLDIDWEQALSGLLGDTPAHLAGKTLRGAHRTMSALAARSRSGAAEYVREESGLGVSYSEAENWYAGVRLLAADTERLAARINRLAFRAGDGPDKQHDS